MKKIERKYKRRLEKITRSAERLLNRGFNNRRIKKAGNLWNTYHRLTREIYADENLSEESKDAWGTAFNHCYDPVINELAIASAAYVQTSSQ